MMMNIIIQDNIIINEYQGTIVTDNIYYDNEKLIKISKGILNYNNYNNDNEWKDIYFYIVKKTKKIYKIRIYNEETLDFIYFFSDYKNDVVRERRKRKLKEIFK